MVDGCESGVVGRLTGVGCGVVYLAFAIAVAVSGCSSINEDPVSCARSSDCPFEQCCVGGECVDPGPVARCDPANDFPETLTATVALADRMVAGEALPFTVVVVDEVGAPVPNVPITLATDAACPNCDSLEVAASSTSAAGELHGAFTSTRAGANRLLVRLGTRQLAEGRLTVVAAEAQRIGFRPIEEVVWGDPIVATVTLLDAFDNPSAPLPPTIALPFTVEAKLAPNHIGVFLKNEVGNAITSVSASFTGADLPLPPVFTNAPAFHLSLVLTSGASLVPVPRELSSAGPRVQSSSPSDLVAAGGADVTVAWSMEPDALTTLIYPTYVAQGRTSPASFMPPVSNDAGFANRLSLVVVPTAAVSFRQVDVEPLLPALTSAGGMTIDRIDAFANDDVLVTGRFTTRADFGRGGVDAVISTGTESFLARYDPSMTELRWHVVFYSVDGDGSGVDTAVRDSVIDAAGNVFVLADYAAAGAGWDFGSGDTRSRCVLGGQATYTSSTTASINGATGTVSSCMGFRQTTASVSAGAVGTTIGTTTYAAVRSVGSYNAYSGTVVSAPVNRVSDVYTSNIAVNGFYDDPACASFIRGATVVMPFAAGALDAAMPTITGVPFDAKRIYPNPDGTNTLLVAGSACTAGSQRVELGGVSSIGATSSSDSAILHLAPSAAQGSRLSLYWINRTCTSSDTLLSATPFGLDSAVMMSVAGSCTFANKALAADNVVVARISSTTRAPLWGVGFATRDAFGSAELSAKDDRLLVALSGDDMIRVIGGGGVFDASQAYDAMGAIADVQHDGVLRWILPVLGSQAVARGLALPRGEVLIGASGPPAGLTVGPHNATPARPAVLDSDQPGVVLGRVTPYNYVQRTIVRQ